MPTAIEPYTSFERGWMIRTRPASRQPPARIVVFIHGWTGDERSMEIFSRGLPLDYLFLFPRGPVHVSGGGYGWVEKGDEVFVRYLDFVSIAHDLMREIDQRLSNQGCGGLPISLAGFSQGAAMAYTLTLLYPNRIERIAALAGFLPTLPLSIDTSGLQKKPIFIAHGTRDETIPVEKARDAVQVLQSAGAQVNYCESTAGHKLAVSCFNQLAEFLTQ